MLGHPGQKEPPAMPLLLQLNALSNALDGALEEVAGEGSGAQ